MSETIQETQKKRMLSGIKPETSAPSTVSDRNTELLSRVKNHAAAILAENKGSFDDSAAVIEQALNPKVIEQLQLPNTKSRPRQEKRATILSFSENAHPIPAAPISATTLNPDAKKACTSSASPKGSSTLRQTVLIPGKSGPIALQNTVEQQVIPGMEPQTQTGDILTLLRQHGVRFVDKRGNGGALWLIGGNELTPIIAEAKRLGFAFHFKEDGGKATKGAPGWWGK